MNNKNRLINSKQLQSKIFKLGQFVKRYVNGIFDEEYDLVNPCAFDYVIHSTLFPLEGEYKQVVIKEDTIVIIMNNGDIVELVKSNRKYFCKGLITIIAKEVFLGKTLLLEAQHIGNNGGIESKVNPITYDEAIQKIQNSFKYGNMRIREKDFCVNIAGENSVSIEFTTLEANVLSCNNKIYVPNDSEEKSFQPKIIQSNKFRSHMQVHDKDFIIPYQNIIQYASYKGYFNGINDRFVDMVVEFPFNIGYSLLCETTAQILLYMQRERTERYTAGLPWMGKRN